MNSEGTQITHTLVLADWTSDPSAVVAACSRQLESGRRAFTLVVPARLHGVDWIGDPDASIGCARRAVNWLGSLAREAGLTVEHAEVGDPDPLAAILDVMLSRPVDQLLICMADRHLWSRSLPVRAQHLTNLPTLSYPVPQAPSAPHGLAARRLFGGQYEAGDLAA